MTDLQAFERYALERDADAFRHLVLAYKDMVYAVCMRRLQNSADVEDAVQETFIKLARRAGDIRQSVGGWLCAAANTTSLDMIKAGAVQRKHETTAARTAARVTEPDTQAAEWPEISQRLDEALQALPAEDRDLIVQYYFLGRTQKQVADELGMVQSTVKRRIDRVVGELRTALTARGIAALSVSALMVCLETQAKAQAPVALTAALTKIGVAGVSQVANAGVGTGASAGLTTALSGAGTTTTATTGATAVASTGGGVMAGLSAKTLILSGAAVVAGIGLTATMLPKTSAPPTNVTGQLLTQPSGPAVDLDRILSPLRVVRVPAQRFLGIEIVMQSPQDYVQIGEVHVPRLITALQEVGIAPAGPLHSLGIQEIAPGSPAFRLTVAFPIREPLDAPEGTVQIIMEAHEAVEAEWYGSMFGAEPAVVGFYERVEAAGYPAEPIFVFVQERFVGLESDENLTRIRARLRATPKASSDSAPQ